MPLYSQPPPFQVVFFTIPLLRLLICVISLTLTNPKHHVNALTNNTNTGYTILHTHPHFLPGLVNEAFAAAQFLVINFKLAGIFLNNTLSPS